MKEIEQIWTDLQSELAALDKQENPIKRTMLSRQVALEAVEKLENFFATWDAFNDDPFALGNFNRNLAPPLYAKYIFFSKVWAFECLKVDASECEQLYEVELARIRLFFQQYGEFRRYYLSGATDNDALYFQKLVRNTLRLDELVVGISPDVNKGCLLVAYMMAFDEYRSYLIELQKGQTEPAIDSDLTWDGDISDLNEVTIALEGRIKKGARPAALTDIRLAFGKLLHVNLANGDQLDNNRRNNLNETSNFLEKLAEKMIKRKKKLAENQKSRKRKL